MENVCLQDNSYLWRPYEVMTTKTPYPIAEYKYRHPAPHIFAYVYLQPIGSHNIQPVGCFPEIFCTLSLDLQGKPSPLHPENRSQTSGQADQPETNSALPPASPPPKKEKFNSRGLLPSPPLKAGREGKAPGKRAERHAEGAEAPSLGPARKEPARVPPLLSQAAGLDEPAPPACLMMLPPPL